MKIDDEVFELFKKIQENGPETVDVNANGQIYHVEADVYDAFIRNCEESSEDFLTRIQPVDDDASYRMSLYVNDLLIERDGSWSSSTEPLKNGEISADDPMFDGMLEFDYDRMVDKGMKYDIDLETWDDDDGADE